MRLTRSSLAFLDKIEQLELQSLEWGCTDGILSETEIENLAKQISDGCEGLVEALIDSKLLFEFERSDGSFGFRSRFGEIVRLLTANRQLFPDRPWQNAPELVSDFRVDRRQRRFPKFDCPPSEVISQCSELLTAGPFCHALWSALTDIDGLRLAKFQMRATQRLTAPISDGGTIITAGTGSGKTLAFYLPAIIRTCRAMDQTRWVKIVAVYPRIELLKDQLQEVFGLVRRTDNTLRKFNRRLLTLGVLYGATPREATITALEQAKWPLAGTDFICPWLRCGNCGQHLIWQRSDVVKKREVLRCTRSNCDTVINHTQLLITRQSMQRSPPDVLFATTEILNQRLSDHPMRTLFGVGRSLQQRPFMALLDEVHSFTGTTGAQTALTLRRWRHLLQSPIHWVGLSATLKNSNHFFSDLCGVAKNRVVEITPKPDEYQHEGIEYQILLKGNPAARASLLSTTIQTSMLLPRMLDPISSNQTDSRLFGQRVFLFADDLDVTNRLYDNLLDAEAYNIFGHPDNKRMPLASLRGRQEDAYLMDLEGQRWRACEDIGHHLHRRLKVSRTSSQDSGVDRDANVVVATSALEVGIDDHKVGAVIQHKAPKGMASFLQRKGRAGRNRMSRPIMLTVLSDYGRDRICFQSYETLFDPELESQSLPISNHYILKIQAVYSFFDWITHRLPETGGCWQWDLLSRPHGRSNGRVQSIKELLRTVYDGDGATIADLTSWLENSLRIDNKTAQFLLWEPPRSLLLEAIPTLYRRLVLDWKLAFPTELSHRDLQVDYHPLPDFIPRNLFSDLALPEVQIVVPPATIKHCERVELMPILPALEQFAPGRVSRRFAFERGGLCHWIPIKSGRTQQNFEIETMAEQKEYLGTFVGRVNTQVPTAPVPVHRPWTMRLQPVTRSEALPQSNSRLNWESDIVPNTMGNNIQIPRHSIWKTLSTKVTFYLHRFRSGVTVRRFARGAKATLYANNKESQVDLRFIDSHYVESAIGFEAEVDGVAIELTLPESTEFLDGALPPSVLYALHTAYLRDAFVSDEYLPQEINYFQRNWLFDFLVCAIIRLAEENDRQIKLAVEVLQGNERIEEAIDEVMSEVLDSKTNGELDDSLDFDDLKSEEKVSNLRRTLRHLVACPTVQCRIRAIASEFIEPDTHAFSKWKHQVLLNSLSEAVLQGCIMSTPRNASDDGLCVDIQNFEDSNTATIWITETTLGGAGVLEAFADEFQSSPTLFFDAIEASLTPNDSEMVDSSLCRIIELAAHDEQVQLQFSRLRSCNSHRERTQLWSELKQRLVRHEGMLFSHALLVSVNNRLLRTGFDPTQYALLCKLIQFWHETEAHYKLAIGTREFCYIASKCSDVSEGIDNFMQALRLRKTANVAPFGILQTLLWSRDHEIRQRLLQSYNPFRVRGTTDPALVRHLLFSRSSQIVDISDDDWKTRLNQSLQSIGSVQLTTSVQNSRALGIEIVPLCTTPVNVGVLQFYPIVDRVDRHDDQILVRLTLRDFV